MNGQGCLNIFRQRAAAVRGLVLLLVLAAPPLWAADQQEEKLNWESVKDVVADPDSPWLITPTVSSDPKLGTTLGAVLGYVKRFDPESTPSLITGFGSYSDTDSWTAGLWSELYFNADQHKLIAAYISGRIRNDYEDFLGTGVDLKTEDDMDFFLARYLHRIKGDWYLGAQGISTNYAIGADGLAGGILEQIGLVGFDSNGLGLVTEFDSRDNRRNPHQGQWFVAHNIAYRESLGGDESFDTFQVNYAGFFPVAEKHVFAVNVRGRWTDDAPLGGYSSLSLRGYTRGNYLDEHYTHIDFEGRFNLTERWGLTAFAGVGCLYESVSDCGDGEALYPAIGGGGFFVLKPDAGIVLRAEYAAGESDNSAFYLQLGHAF